MEIKLNKRNRREPTYTTSGVVRVPLANHDEPVLMDRADFDRLTDLGLTSQYTLNGNERARYVRCRPPRTKNRTLLTVARLVLDAGHRHRVKYRDGNRLNLRRGNLYIVAYRGRDPEGPAPHVAVQPAAEAR